MIPRRVVQSRRRPRALTTAQQIWQQIESRQFKEAVAACTAAIRKATEADAQHFRHYRGIAYLGLRDFESALVNFRVCEEQERSRIGIRHTHYIEQMGLSLWLMGKEREAADVWLSGIAEHNAKRVTHGDGAGGIRPGLLVWFASARTELQAYRPLALDFLDRQCVRAAKRPTPFVALANWPAPLAQFALGEMDEQTMLQQAVYEPEWLAESKVVAQEPNERRFDGKLCQAHFYVATRARIDGDRKRFTAEMRTAEKLGAGPFQTETEYFLSKKESRRKSI